MLITTSGLEEKLFKGNDSEKLAILITFPPHDNRDIDWNAFNKALKRVSLWLSEEPEKIDFHPLTNILHLKATVKFIKLFIQEPIFTLFQAIAELDYQKAEAQKEKRRRRAS
ncbi:MAG: hypothetical protein AAB604_00190 [Patescibacteria group bacterium]